MPTVPVIDQNATPAPAFAGGSVTPFRNAAPEQIAQLGGVVSPAGDVALKTGQTIGDALAAQVDDAKVKAAEASALNQVQVINHDPQTGYLNQRGQDAINGYQPAKQAVSKAFDDQVDGLSNPIQKLMYRQVMQQHLLSIGQQMADHNFAQTSQYAGEAAVSRANTFAESASNAAPSYGQTDADGNPTGDFAKNLGTAEQETLQAVHVMKGAPANSDVAKEALLNLHTQVGGGVVSQLMDGRASAARVQQVYDDMKAKGWLTERATDTLGKMVKTYTEQESVRANSNLYLSDAARASQGQPTSATGTPDYQSFAVKGATITTSAYDPEQGNVTVNVPSGSKIQAPADGTVKQVGSDADGNFTIQIQHPNGSITTFAGLSAANVKAGETVQRGEDIAMSGTADGIKPGVLWSLADKDGNAVDPMRAGLGPIDLTKITDEKVLSDALDRMRKNVTDPYLQQQTTNEMEMIVRRNQQMANAAQTQMKKQADDQFYAGDMRVRSITPSVFNQLPPELQQHYKDEEQQHLMQQVERSNFWKTQSETGIVSDFYANPQDITVANVEAANAQGKLSRSTYLQLMDQAGKMGKDAQAVAEATHLRDRIRFLAAPAGINVYPSSEEDKSKLNELTLKVSDDLASLKAQNHGKATPEQVDGIIRNEVQQRTIVVPRASWSPMRLFSGPSTTKDGYQFQAVPPATPDGATKTGLGSDGKRHYLNDKNEDLGVVP